MSSLKRHEGYLLIDNRSAPGVSKEEAARLGKGGIPGLQGAPLTEVPTITCSHCQVVVIINNLRERPRAYCAKCDHYICDRCGAVAAQTRECVPFKRILDEQQEQAAREEQRARLGILLTSP